MSAFDSAKLATTFVAPITPFRPAEGRRYTLAHSDVTGNLFLTIGPQFLYSANPNKDEVFAEWNQRMGEFSLSGKVYISSGEFDEQYSRVRYMIFKKEMNLALKAIAFGDRMFFTCYPWLLDSPIYIKFESVYPEFDNVLFFGTMRQHLTAALKETANQQR